MNHKYFCVWKRITFSMVKQNNIIFVCLTVVWGECNHSFHNCCMSLWVKQNNRCPLCQQDWVVQRIGKQCCTLSLPLYGRRLTCSIQWGSVCYLKGNILTVAPPSPQPLYNDLPVLNKSYATGYDLYIFIKKLESNTRLPVFCISECHQDLHFRRSRIIFPSKCLQHLI